MLTPEYLSELPEEILKLFAEAETEILADMARRLAKYDFWIPSAEYQNQKLLESGILQEDILKILSSATRKSEAELRRMMQEAGSMSLKASVTENTRRDIILPIAVRTPILRPRRDTSRKKLILLRSRNTIQIQKWRTSFRKINSSSGILLSF